MRAHALSLLVLVVGTTFLTHCNAVDTIDLTTSITGNETLVSAGGVFALGFFSPPGGRTYLGIWYASIPVRTVVWVANRNDPLVSVPGVLKLTPGGRLVIVDRRNSTVWSSPAPTTKSQQITTRATAQLRDDGNFLLSSDGSGTAQSVAWQSFDYPTDTHLPGMKLGVDLRTGIARNITSYVSPTDPAPGAYTFKLVMGGMPEFFLFRGPEKIYASGPWNGASLTGVQDKAEGYTFMVVSNPDETYYAYYMSEPSMLARFVMDGTSGQLQSYVWGNGAWSMYWYYPSDPCDSYARCGPFGYCDLAQPTGCSCLPGFRPRSEQRRILGCVRETELSCPGAGDGFWPVNRMKLPDASNATVRADMTLDQCRQLCLRSCNCSAYAAANVSGGVSRGCVIWAVDLVDMRRYSVVVQDVYIRLAQSEVDALTAAAGLYFD
jgi:hypothetical protein